LTSGRRVPKPRKEAPKGVLKKPRPVWFVTLMAFVLPGSGQVFNGSPARGVIMQFGIIFAAFISYQLTTPDISPIGRMAGGLLVYVFSIVDANGIASLRVKAWERIETGQPPRNRGKGVKGDAAGKSRTSGARKKGVARVAGQEGGPAGAAKATAGEPAESEDGAGASPVSSERPSG
jgi:hypothetical protein